MSVFRDYGYRRLRGRARLKFLVADWGVDRFRKVLETSTCSAHCSAARTRLAARQRRPRRRAPADGRPLLRRHRADRGSGLRHHAGQAGRRGRGPRRDAGPDDAVPEAARARRRTPTRSTRWSTGCDGIGLSAQPVASGGARRWPAPASSSASSPSWRPRTGRPAGRRAGATHPGARHPDHDPTQRLPELVRPDPGRRHRAEGPAGPGRRRVPWSRDSRCTSAAGGVWTAGFGRKLRGHKSRRTS